MKKKKASRKKPVRKLHRIARGKKTVMDDSQRGLWSGAISFGLINIGVKMISAREAKDIHFTMVDPTNLSPVGYKYYNKVSGEDIQRNKTVKAFEYKPHKFVIFTEADFKKANPRATRTIDIENFVNLSEIDPIFFEKAYYLIPAKNNEKPYKLLVEALSKSDKAAIATLVLHTKQHLAAVFARGEYLIIELLHFAEDVKELRELKAIPGVEGAKISPREVQMAEQLITDMTAKWNPDHFKNTYRKDVMAQVNAKVKAGKATELTEDFEVKSDEESDSEVIDLLPLLRKSLGKKRKTG